MQAAFSPWAGYQNVVSLPVDQELSVHNPVGTTAGGKMPGILSPRNPIFWFGAIAAVSLGLIGFGANVRVGAAKASAGVGEA